MNSLENLCNIALKEKIDIIESKFYTDTKARSFRNSNEFYIFLNKAMIRSTIEEKEILAEELGHYYTGTYYTLNSSQSFIDWCECKALKWAYSVLVPFKKLQEKILQGLNIFELAEFFELDYEYMQNAISFYTEKYRCISLNKKTGK